MAPIGLEYAAAVWFAVLVRLVGMAGIAGAAPDVCAEVKSGAGIGPDAGAGGQTGLAFGIEGTERTSQSSRVDIRTGAAAVAPFLSQGLGGDAIATTGRTPRPSASSIYVPESLRSDSRRR